MLGESRLRDRHWVEVETNLLDQLRRTASTFGTSLNEEDPTVSCSHLTAHCELATVAVVVANAQRQPGASAPSGLLTLLLGVGHGVGALGPLSLALDHFMASRCEHGARFVGHVSPA